MCPRICFRESRPYLLLDGTIQGEATMVTVSMSRRAANHSFVLNECEKCKYTPK